MELLAGAGTRRERLFGFNGKKDWDELVTLDINPDHKPDVVHDLTVLPLPFPDDTFDEIHFYEVLEHLGQQGDYRAWFAEWSEWWRILKPGGVVCGTSPTATSPWAWGDPGHTRIVSAEAMTFLSQSEYDAQIGKTPMTDYRFCYKADFVPLMMQTEGRQLAFALRAIKPSRISI
jgi:SAM-dependent methyltransferase